MGVICILLGCFLLYSKSVYFPKQLDRFNRIAQKKKILFRSGGYLLFSIALIVFIIQLGVATGLTVFFLSLIFGFCITLIALPLNLKYIYLLTALCIVIIVIENTI